MRWQTRFRDLTLGWLSRSASQKPIEDFEFLDGDSTSYYAGPFPKADSHIFVDLDLEIDISWEHSRQYRYSKLYFSSGIDQEFSEDRVICFRISDNCVRHRVRVRLPENATANDEICLRFDPFPYTQGQAYVYGCMLVSESNPDQALSEAANIDALKRETRGAVEKSERDQLEVVPHFPESLSLELQSGCNLQCTHCATHGTPESHAHNNRIGAIELPRLRALASEVFPYLTLLHLVGRGEPLMVSDALWDVLENEVRRNRLLLTVVTNGSFVERRITRKILPYIDTLTISIDGFSPDVFASNRGGASFEKVIQAVSYYHEMRKSARLPRRPKLCISWTLKKNNIAELPAFVRFMEQFEPDRYYMRHLLVSRDQDQSESLLDTPDLANHYLAEAYEIIAAQGVSTDCPPLIDAVVDLQVQGSATALVAAKEAPRQPAPREKICHYIHRTGSINSEGTMKTCAVYYAKKVGTFGADNSFLSLWNGETMRRLRGDINTQDEWDQCRNCWFRESRFQSQRVERANLGAYSLLQKTNFSQKAWDYRSRNKA